MNLPPPVYARKSSKPPRDSMISSREGNGLHSGVVSGGSGSASQPKSSIKSAPFLDGPLYL